MSPCQEYLNMTSWRIKKCDKKLKKRRKKSETKLNKCTPRSDCTVLWTSLEHCSYKQNKTIHMSRFHSSKYHLAKSIPSFFPQDLWGWSLIIYHWFMRVWFLMFPARLTFIDHWSCLLSFVMPGQYTTSFARRKLKSNPMWPIWILFNRSDLNFLGITIWSFLNKILDAT